MAEQSRPRFCRSTETTSSLCLCVSPAFSLGQRVAGGLRGGGARNHRPPCYRRTVPSSEPTVWTRVYSHLRGEVSGASMEAYRRAGASVLELMEQAEHRRLQCRIEGHDPWTMPAAARAEILCAWNAFVLHTLGAALLDADEQHHPGTRGYLPPAVAAEAMACFRGAEAWASRARQARASPGFRVDAPLPAELPRPRVEPGTSAAHFQGLLRALHVVHGYAASALGFVPEHPAGAQAHADAGRIRERYAAAEAQAHFAEALWSTRAPADVRARAEVQVRRALGEFHRVGQCVADPHLVSGAPPAPRPLAALREAAAESGRVTGYALIAAAADPLLPMDRRVHALDRVLRAPVDLDALAELYVRLDARELRVRILAALEVRPEPGAVEMLAHVARGDDPALREVARRSLSRSQHPHAQAMRDELRHDARHTEWEQVFLEVSDWRRDLEERKRTLAAAFRTRPPASELMRLFQKLTELPLRGMLLFELQRRTDPEARQVLWHIATYTPEWAVREFARELYDAAHPPHR